jgi:hypothetical protein
MSKTVCCTLLGILVALYTLPAHAQSLQTNEISSGACMVVCEDVSFCKTSDYNDGIGTCTIVMNPTDQGFIQQRNACPNVAPQEWIVSFSGGRWQIACPPGPVGPIPNAPPLTDDLMKGLEDPK